MVAHAEREFGRADVARFDENVLHAQIGEGPVIVQDAIAICPRAVFAKNDRVGTHFVFVERGGGGDNLECRAWLHHVDDGAILHLLGFRFGAMIEIKRRAIRHGEDLPGLRTHQNDRRLLRRVFAHGRVDFVFDDVLQIKIDGEMNLIAVARSAFLAAIKHDLLTGAIVFDVTVAVLPVQIVFHGSFHALNATVIEVGEPDNVREHRAVRINAGGIALKINAAQILRTEFSSKRIRHRLRNFAFHYDVAPLTA